MHRNLELIVSPEHTDGLISELNGLDGVLTVAVHRGHSVKPPGDVIVAEVLNHETDGVLRAVLDGGARRALSISTASVDSLVVPEEQAAVRADVDEVVWEEAETAMRRHTRPNANFALTTAAGGVIAGAGLTASSGVTEATALVAAAIIAPVFEPLVRLGLAAVNRRARLVLNSVGMALLSYLILIAGAVATMLVLRAAGDGYVDEFLRSPTVHDLQYPPTASLIISAAGAIAGIVMVSAGRFTQLAGPLVALQLIPAAAAIGDALELGHGGIAARSLGRLAIDVGMVLVAAGAVFTYKHFTAHGRRRLAA